MDDNKNLILAIVLSAVILFGWQALFTEPVPDPALQGDGDSVSDSDSLGFEEDTLGNSDALGTPDPARTEDELPVSDPVEEVVARPDPVLIEGAKVRGSISPIGVQFNDLILTDYFNEVGEEGGNVVLFRGKGEPSAYFADFNWRTNPGVERPDENTVWQVSGGSLTPENPVEFSWTNSQGVTFRQTVSLDEDYLFTVRQSVTNNSQAPIQVAPTAQITRFETPKTLGFFILHEGPIGYLSGELYDRGDDFTYEDFKELYEENATDQTRRVEIPADDGWVGFSGKYWASALVPEAGTNFKARFYFERENGRDKFISKFLGNDGVTLAPGQTSESQTYLFAGAKEVDVLDRYENENGFTNFDLLIDWGWFYFLTKPIFYGLEILDGVVGNVGVAILILTVFIKLLLFPMANKSYRSMSRVKKLQPKIQQIRERFADDKLRLQQETMALYKKEKVNPAGGCLPILVQIPVFFALYKVLFVTLEMRHQPFFGWIQDLSAKDPLTFITGFGLFPWDAPGFLEIGLWPLIMGLTMWFQQKLNPTSPDPIQAKVFMFMPIIFTFILAPFPAGLVIYWTWNNILSIGQQWVIMKKEGVAITDGK